MKRHAVLILVCSVALFIAWCINLGRLVGSQWGQWQKEITR